LSKTLTFAVIRLATAAGIVFGVSWQIIDRLVHNVFRPGEYFAYFTILTSIFTAVVLVWSGIQLARTGKDSASVAKLRLSATTAYVIVAVVYNALLRNDTSMAPQDVAANYHWPTPPNEILHVWAPLIVLIDFVLSRFGDRLNLKQMWNVLIYPLVWLVLTIIRGIVTGWWPYWFLNPTEKGGVPGMIMYAGAITVFFALVGLGLTAIQKRGGNAQKS
jgi:hypothetical protein